MNKKSWLLLIGVAVISSAMAFMGISSLTDGEKVKVVEAVGEENVEQLGAKDAVQPEPEKPKKIKASIIATGDIMFHSTQVKAAYDKQTDSYSFDQNFKHIKKYVEKVDLAVANFETVTAGREHGFRGFPTFNTPKTALEAIKNSGFDVLATANNHSLDMGKEGILETIDNIKDVGMKSFGTYKEPTKDILIEDINGIKVAFLSYTYSLNGLDSRLTQEELTYMINRIDEAKIKADIEEADKQGVDLTAVMIHWGHEYHRDPSVVQKDLANKMVMWGADLILGSHPHVIQPSEIIEYEGEKKFIIYSMGNFISNQRRETLSFKNRNFTEDGVLVNLNLEKDLETNKTRITKVDYIPTWVYRFKEAGRYNYEILPVKDFKEDVNLPKSVRDKLSVSETNTMSLMEEYEEEINKENEKNINTKKETHE